MTTRLAPGSRDVFSCWKSSDGSNHSRGPRGHVCSITAAKPDERGLTANKMFCFTFLIVFYRSFGLVFNV